MVEEHKEEEQLVNPGEEVKPELPEDSVIKEGKVGEKEEK